MIKRIAATAVVALLTTASWAQGVQLQCEITNQSVAMQPVADASLVPDGSATKPTVVDASYGMPPSNLPEPAGSIIPNDNTPHKDLAGDDLQVWNNFCRGQDPNKVFAWRYGRCSGLDPDFKRN